MSPFLLSTGELASCMAAGERFPYEHAGTCACPCPPCVEMHRRVLKRLGLFPMSGGLRHRFLFAFGELHLSAAAFTESSDEWFFERYREIASAREEGGIPVATFGWLVSMRAPSDCLIVVKAPSDPSDGAADHALAAWARSRSLELRSALETAFT